MKSLILSIARIVAVGALSSLPLLSVAQSTDYYTLTPESNPEAFELREEFSDEFEGGWFNTENWVNPTDFNFAAWSFAPENVEVEDGRLKLNVVYDKHNRPSDKKQFYFKSGLLRSRETVGYGYYEAKIKGAELWPGTCTAFWLYTKINPASLPQEENFITYNEIDVIEMQQIARDKDILACNMHFSAFVRKEDGELKVKRYMAGQYPHIGQNQFNLSKYWGEDHWVPEDDFHIYGVENRPDSVVFYIDNKRVASKPNYFWHLDMYLCLSLGIRKPFEYYTKDGARFASPTTEQEAEAAGFPATMEIEWIRSYHRKGGEYSEEQFPSSKIPFDPKIYPVNRSDNRQN